LPARFDGLVLSFHAGATVFSAARLKQIVRVAYSVLGLLLIFVVGFKAADLAR
jgi:hypothetical protein